jgi:hypothetical protein
LGPVVNPEHAQRIRKQVHDASQYQYLSCGCLLTTTIPVIVEAGAKALIPEGLFATPEMYGLLIWQRIIHTQSRIVSGNLEGTAYIPPQVLVDVNHSEFIDS